MAYKKGDDEYISNGHYRIDGEDWMSIWTYKNKMGLMSNYTVTNGSDAKELMSRGVATKQSQPDFGSFSAILIFRESDLNNYYDEL